MKQLVQQADAFKQQSDLTEAFVAEYYTTNERKKADEKWLKTNKSAFTAAMEKLGKSKADFGQYRVSIITPNTGNFDDTLTLKFLADKGLLDKTTKVVLDEEKITELIEHGEIDLAELQSAAWVTKTGTPRLTVTLIGNGK